MKNTATTLLLFLIASFALHAKTKDAISPPMIAVFDMTARNSDESETSGDYSRQLYSASDTDSLYYLADVCVAVFDNNEASDKSVKIIRI